MDATDRQLWSFTEAAALFGLSPIHGCRTISDLAAAWRIQTKPNGSGRRVGLDRSDLSVIAKALNRKLPSPRRRSA